MIVMLMGALIVNGEIVICLLVAISDSAQMALGIAVVLKKIPVIIMTIKVHMVINTQALPLDMHIKPHMDTRLRVLLSTAAGALGVLVAWRLGSTGTQTRTCTNPLPSGGGADCSGPSTQACSAPACSVSFGPPGGAGAGGGGGSTSIYTGGSATLEWSSDASSCTGTNFDTGGAPSGSVVVSPISTTTYTISCGSGAGETTSEWTVIVKKKPFFIEN